MASNNIDWSLTSQTDSRRSSPSHVASAWRSAGAAAAVSAASIATMFLLLPLAIRAGVRVLTLTLDGCVWLATEMSAGADPLAIASAVGHAASDTLATGTASSVLTALTMDGCVWLATEMSAGADALAIVSAVGRAVSDTLATGTASSVLTALTAAGALGFYVLQRLLDTDG